MDFKEILPLLGTILGGALTLLGSKISESSNRKKERRLERLKRCEEMYSLSQDIYDGHRGEIEKFRTFAGKTHEDWRKHRSHPGESMSRLKMLIKIYEPSLRPVLEQVSASHALLKAQFIETDHDFSKLRDKKLTDLFLTELNNLGLACNQFKEKVAEIGSQL